MPSTFKPSQYTKDNSMRLKILDRLLRERILELKAISTVFSTGS
jgi:hypothetical protein